MTAKVESVLEFNNSIRDEMLRRNIGKYSQYNGGLNPAIGEYYNIDYNRSLEDLKDGKDLLSYTHDGKSDYSEEINRKFFQFGEKEEYFVKPLTYGMLNPWVDFQKGSYIQYIDEVLGKDDVMQHVNYINDLLSGQYIQNALRQTEVGVIRDINVAAALQGIVTTNPNNMSGEDTTLGKIGNTMYARTLYNGAIFNSDRMKAKIKVGENYYQKTYLTPDLVNKYGNNLATVMSLSDILQLGIEETQVREDLGKDVHILDGHTENNFADLTLPQFRILNEQIKQALNLRGVEYTSGQNTPPSSKAIRYVYSDREDYQENINYRDTKGNDLILPTRVYTPINGQGYVNASKKDTDWRYDDLGFTNDNNEFDDLGSEQLTSNVKTTRLFGPYKTGMYNEIGSNELNFEDNEFNSYESIDPNKNDLLSKTSRLFNKGRLDTIIARFHTNKVKYGEVEFTDTARSRYGHSHGRNLLRLDALTADNDTNGYENPYCRTWTYHHQYNQVKKLIRPFTNDDGNIVTNKDVQKMNEKYRAFRRDSGEGISGIDRLAKNTVLQDNGFVRITPSGTATDANNEVKKCMFSIENLAWKDVLKLEDNISKEQTGPNGGRIMWFPPYDLDFQEGVQVEWNSNTFIGRGEKVYTYTNTDRTGTLSFALLIDHPAIINSVTNSIGMGEEKDPEADILRFFAGCNLLENVEQTNGNENNGEDGVGDGEYLEEQKQLVKFKVYFPNNFSGIVTKSNGKSLFDDGNEHYDYFEDFVDGTFDRKYIADYWWIYLLTGNNTCIPSSETSYMGYEMHQGSGISNNNYESNKWIPVCIKNQYVVGDEPHKKPDEDFYNTCEIGLNNDKRYQYQVDEDLHQQLSDDGNYKDIGSTQLNIIKNDNDRQDDEYTFVEVLMALLQNSTTYQELYEKYHGYVEGLGVDTEKINKLVDLLKSKDTKITGIRYGGCADINDSKNMYMLAVRRSKVCIDLVKRLYPQANNIDPNKIQPDIQNGGNTKNPSVSCLENKKARYADIELEFTIKTKKQKDTAGDRGEVEQEDTTSGITFDEYLQALLDFSDVIEAYYNAIHEYDNGTLEKKLKEHYNSIKDNINLDDDEFKRNDVDDILEEIVNYDAIFMAYAISDSASNSNFTSSYTAESYGSLTRYDAETPLLNGDDSDYLRYLIVYFVTIGAKFNDFDISSDGYSASNPRLFEYTFLLDKYPGAEHETKYFQTYKFISHLMLVHYIKDKFSDFDIDTTKNKETYLSELYSLTKGNTELFQPIYDMINYRIVYTEIDRQYKYFDLQYYFEDEIIPPLNERIELIEDAEKNTEKKANSQNIEQIRPDTQENKAAKQDIASDETVVHGLDTSPQPNTRYETEGEYFSHLQNTDPLLFKNIQKKFQYFNPAFHSISPEGFNARLTFLQQCTRQGNTCETKAKDGKNRYTSTASNLSFGRMPVCVIRIGDFINTRAIINSMTISYAANNGIVWDLNPEGAGVQPMYAKISLAITLLGGQSLEAPISRLQNAISFNYYANAEVYDNRADIASYVAPASEGENGYVKYDRIWTPLQKEVEYEKDSNDRITGIRETGKYINNETDDFVGQHRQDATWKDLSDEEIAKKYPKPQQQTVEK